MAELATISRPRFLIFSTVYLTAGTMLLMWLGEQITQRGIGNGVSLLITVGILADIPGAAAATYQLFFAPVGTNSLGLPAAIIMIALFLIVTMGIIAVTQGQRKIPVQYAKRVVGQKVYGGQSSFLPLKVNYSGVMPVIFASAILLFPQQIFSQVGAYFDIKFLVEFSNNLLRGHWTYYAGMALLILFFSYFWVSVMFKPIQVADDLKPRDLVVAVGHLDVLEQEVAAIRPLEGCMSLRVAVDLPRAYQHAQTLHILAWPWLP